MNRWRAESLVTGYPVRVASVAPVSKSWIIGAHASGAGAVASGFKQLDPLCEHPSGGDSGRPEDAG